MADERMRKKLWGGRFTGRRTRGLRASTARSASTGGSSRRTCAGASPTARDCARRACWAMRRQRPSREGLRGLLERAEAEGEAFFADEAAEDVHSFIEARLIESVGDAGRKLHTGRSRNDQVATALRLWLRDEIDRARRERCAACSRRCSTSPKRTRTQCCPATRTSSARSPCCLAHWCLAYFEMLSRDRERLSEVQAADERVAARLGGARGDEPPD